MAFGTTRSRSISLILAILVIFTVGRFKSSNTIADSLNSSSSAERDLSSALLNTPLPYRDFSKLAKYPPQNLKDKQDYAFATLMCTREPDERDPFFAAAQQLVWRILWSPWRSIYPMIVFVCPSTPQYQRTILAGQGAVVEEIELVSGLIDPTKLHLSRWRDQLTKINMWTYTRYKRIAFMDSDAFPVKNIDDIFDIVPLQDCDANRLNTDDLEMLHRPNGQDLCKYTFGGAIMSETDNELNGGFFVFSPNLMWHEKLLRDAKKTNEYDEKTAEQGLLNSNLGFGINGPYKRYTISQDYNSDKEYYIAKKEAGKLDEIRIVHCKMWSPLSLLWAPELNVKWDVDWMSMCRWYDSDAFVSARTGVSQSL